MIALQMFGVVTVSAEPTVTDVRIGVHSTTTRFVMDMTKTVNYKHIFPLTDPYRIVIDLPPQLKWQVPVKSQLRNIGLIAGFRNGLFNPSTYRVVLDLKGPAKIKSSFILPPAEGKRYRLVIDLVASKRMAVLANREGMLGGTVKSKAKEPKSLSIPIPGRKPNPSSQKQRIIVIDPGHGGIDPGAISKSRIFEKHVVMAAAKAFKRRLERDGKYKVVLTRNKDIFVRLRERISIARKNNADLFISLHADAIKSKKVRGMSVYTLSKKASSKEAAALAERENKSDLIAGVDGTEPLDVTKILIDLAQRRSKNESSRFAKLLVGELKNVGKMLPKSQRSAGFAVLKSPDITSVLIELGYLSNSRDANALLNNHHRAKLANALFNAVDSYCSDPTDPCSGPK